MTDLRKAAENLLQILDSEPESMLSWIDNIRNAREELRQALAESANSTTSVVESKAVAQLKQTCPPCNQNCNQGRTCPSR